MSEKFFDSNNLDAWEKAAAKQSPGGDVGNLVWNTPEGLAVKALRIGLPGTLAVQLSDDELATRGFAARPGNS